MLMSDMDMSWNWGRESRRALCLKRKMWYQFLEACYPHLKPASLVSTPHRCLALVPKVGLKTIVLKCLIHTGYDYDVYTQTFPADYLFSLLNPSTGRLEKLSSSNGFHAGCAAVSVALPDARTAAPALLWSCPASTTPSWAAWAMLGWDVNDLLI